MQLVLKHSAMLPYNHIMRLFITKVAMHLWLDERLVCNGAKLKKAQLYNEELQQRRPTVGEIVTLLWMWSLVFVRYRVDVCLVRLMRDDAKDP